MEFLGEFGEVQVLEGRIGRGEERSMGVFGAMAFGFGGDVGPFFCFFFCLGLLHLERSSGWYSWSEKFFLL